MSGDMDGVWSMGIAGTILGTAVAKSRRAVMDVSEVGIWCVVIVRMGGIGKFGRCVMRRQSPGGKVTSRLDRLGMDRLYRTECIFAFVAAKHRLHSLVHWYGLRGFNVYLM